MNNSQNFDRKIEIRKRCKGVHCVDLGESFPTNIYLMKSASIQPRTSLSKLGEKFNSLFIRLLIPDAIRRSKSTSGCCTARCRASKSPRNQCCPARLLRRWTQVHRNIGGHRRGARPSTRVGSTQTSSRLSL